MGRCDQETRVNTNEYLVSTHEFHVCSAGSGRAATRGASEAGGTLHPAAIGWIAFFCTLPASFILAALNYRKAGLMRRGIIHLVGAGVALGLLGAVVGNAGALRGVLSLALEIAGIAYLVRDTRAHRRVYREIIGVYDVPTSNAVLIGVTVLVVTVALMVWYGGRVIGQAWDTLHGWG